jgi:arylsulfatase
VTVRFDFVYDGGGPGRGGNGTLYVNDEKVAATRIEHTASVIFSPDETADVGVDEATNVTADYRELDNQFTGRIHKVTVEVK